MANCDFIRLDAKRLQCIHCERITEATVRMIPDPRKLVRTCPVAKPPIIPPPMFRRLKNFTRASIAHALNLLPTCTEAEIQERFAVCCGCELFKQDETRPAVGICCHDSCGCTMGREANFLNKLGWADQGCPLGKWRPTR